MKTRQYHQYFPFHLTVGEEVTIAGVKYYCIVECTVAGYTIDTEEPIITDGDSVRVSEKELVKVKDFRTKPDPCLTRIANYYLGKYERVHLADLVGRTVTKTLIVDGSLLIMCDGDTYIKKESNIDDYSERESLKDVRLTIEDLRALKLINGVDWGLHVGLLGKEVKKRTEFADKKMLREAAARLDAEGLREILEDSV